MLKNNSKAVVYNCASNKAQNPGYAWEGRLIRRLFARRYKASVRISLALICLFCVAKTAISSGPCDIENFHPLLETSKNEPEVFFARLWARKLLSKELVHCENALWRAEFLLYKKVRGDPPKRVFAEYVELYSDPYHKEYQCASTASVNVNYGEEYLIIRNPSIKRMLTPCSPYYRQKWLVNDDDIRLISEESL